MDHAKAKKNLRQRMLPLRAAIAASERFEQSKAACLLAEREVLRRLRQSGSGKLTIFSYVSFRDEPETKYLRSQCLDQGDRVLVPRIVGQHEMELCEIHGEDDLTTGAWGIPEPKSTAAIWPKTRYADIDLVIVPGLAFDLQGGRIGFGGGYYDRFISRLASVCAYKHRQLPIMASIALQECIVPVVPMEEHDFRLNMLFTASGVIYMKESSESIWSNLQRRRE